MTAKFSQFLRYSLIVRKFGKTYYNVCDTNSKTVSEHVPHWLEADKEQYNVFPRSQSTAIVKLDPYSDPDRWPPHLHYGRQAPPLPPFWCDQRPGRSSDPVTPVGGPIHGACPVHSSFRYRALANGGPDFHHFHRSHQGIRDKIKRMERCLFLADVDVPIREENKLEITGEM
ncbi:hypothetical protein ABEB36_004354 [Hypothenemus hampei]|uniref:Uncharacterized protein n=1 Tax=Hypothenemus hampei TaxID=57062 RepID=A0ABD1F318_HYPHA